MYKFIKMSNIGLKKIDKLLLRSFLTTFTSLFLLVLFVLVIQHFLILFKEIAGKGLGMDVYARILFYIGLALFPNAFPISVLIASLLVFGNFAENFELTAMRSVGLSLQRIFRFPLLFILVISSALCYFQEYIHPTIRPQIFALVSDVSQKKAAFFIQEGIFCNNIPGYGIRVNKKLSTNRDMEGIIVYDHTKQYGTVAITAAEKGRLYTTPEGDCLIMELVNGHNYIEPLPTKRGKEHNYENHPFYRSSFAHQKIRIGLEALQLGNTHARFAYDARTRTRPQLKKMVEERRQKVLEERTYSKQLLAQKAVQYGVHTPSSPSIEEVPTGGCADAPTVATSATFKHFRGQLMEDSIRTNASKPCDPFARLVLQRALRTIAQTKSALYTQRQDEVQMEYNLHAALFEKEHRLAVAIRCIIMFLLAAPLGCIIRKGGFGISVLISSFFMLLEYVISMMGREWVEAGTLSPFLGAWMANITLLPFCCFFLAKGQKGTGLSLAFRWLRFWHNAAKGRYAADPCNTTLS